LSPVTLSACSRQWASTRANSGLARSLFLHTLVIEGRRCRIRRLSDCPGRPPWSRNVSPQIQPPTLDVLTALAIDQRGRMAMTSVVDLEYWKPLTRISDERFTPGANVALCKQTDDILTALAIDRDGYLQVASVARVEFWKPPIPISDPVFAPGNPVAMAKQTDGVLTALAVDKYGLLYVASVGGLEDWKKPVAISDAVFIPGTSIAMAKQTEGILTALAVGNNQLSIVYKCW
jgi:hypothetical protein